MTTEYGWLDNPSRASTIDYALLRILARRIRRVEDLALPGEPPPRFRRSPIRSDYANDGAG